MKCILKGDYAVILA